MTIFVGGWQGEFPMSQVIVNCELNVSKKKKIDAEFET